MLGGMSNIAKHLKQYLSSTFTLTHSSRFCHSISFTCLMLGLHCRSDQLDRSRLPKVPDRTRSMACTRLLLERYSIIPDGHTSAQDSYTTLTRLTTRSLLEHTDLNRIPSRSVHEQLD